MPPRIKAGKRHWMTSKFGLGLSSAGSSPIAQTSWVEPKPAWRPRKETYLASLPAKPAQSLLVSLADKVDNAEAILQDYRVLGDDLWSRFTGGRQGTIWYYRSLSEIFSKALPGALATELSRTVSQFPAD